MLSQAEFHPFISFASVTPYEKTSDTVIVSAVVRSQTCVSWRVLWWVLLTALKQSSGSSVVLKQLLEVNFVAAVGLFTASHMSMVFGHAEREYSQHLRSLNATCHVQSKAHLILKYLFIYCKSYLDGSTRQHHHVCFPDIMQHYIYPKICQFQLLLCLYFNLNVQTFLPVVVSSVSFTTGGWIGL